jgi:predicted permease
MNLRHALRTLARRPGLSAVAIVTLAVGIGANTAIFTYTNALLLRPLDVSEPERVVRLYATSPTQGRFDVFSYANYADLRDRSASFTALAAHQRTTASVSLGTAGGAEQRDCEVVTGNYFAVMGETPLLGRLLAPEDDRTVGGHPVAVISHRLWTERLAADPAVIGRRLLINAHPFTIVGVTREAFRGSYEALPSDVWAPLAMYEQVRPRGVALTNRGWGWLSGAGRLQPGVTREQAQAELDRLAAQLRREHPGSNEKTGFRIYPAGALPEEYAEGARRLLAFALAVTALVLLVACSNVAALLLGAGVARSREIATRLALGAGRGRIARQLVTESALLALAGAGAGMLLAAWTRDLLLLLAPPGFGLSPVLEADSRVLAFTLAGALVTGIIFGVVPALAACRRDPVGALRAAAAGPGAPASRLFSAFVIGQVALSCVLLVAAGLLLRSLRESALFDPGFRTERLVLLGADLKLNGYTEARGRDLYARLLDRLKALPGVEGASMAMLVPLSGSSEGMAFRVPGREKPVSIARAIVGPDYFATMGIPLVAGRDFTPAVANREVIVNQTMARRYWPEENAVGKVFQVAGGPAVEIVGVARDSKYYSLGEEPRPYVYMPFAQFYWPDMVIHVRAARDTSAALAAARAEFRALDPELAVSAATFEELRAGPLAPARAMAWMSAVFGAVALALTAIGLYGILAYTVGLRTREIGVRMALGAQRHEVARQVVTRALWLCSTGAALGLAAAAAVSQLLKEALFGVRPLDPMSFTVAAAVLALTALAAALLPAHRAASVDPITALREE